MEGVSSPSVEVRWFRVLLMCALLSVAGCSSKATYDNIQHNNRQACNRVPPPQYEACIERSSKPYEEYERERQAVIGTD